MRSSLSIVIATVLTILVALPFAAPFSTCTLADILSDQPDEMSIGPRTVATIGTVTATADDASDAGSHQETRLRASLTMSAATQPRVPRPTPTALPLVGRHPIVHVQDAAASSMILRV
jgi:hypothetical protein